MATKKTKSLKGVVITRPLDQASEPGSPPLEGLIGQRMVNPVPTTSRVSVHEGLLMKRCRLCWRERIVEVIRDSADYAGIKTSYQLLIFDPRKRTLKDRISMDDIVTIRASCDCYFQIFLSNGKILQFRADSMESQAYWMSLIKVGLGRGSIFHVRVHTARKGLEHALLYSIGVNLPAHRVGQLDRILVLASPVNDINIHAWDLNRVKHFMRLDIGVQMELCASCTTSHIQGTSITFIMDKIFHDECINFLCREAHISNEPMRQNSLLVYPVDHICTHEHSRDLPSYTVSQQQTREGGAGGGGGGGVRQQPRQTMNDYSTTESFNPQLPLRGNIYSTTQAVNNANVKEGGLQTAPPVVPGGSGGASVSASSSYEDISTVGDSLPPRSITRQNYATAIPAVAHPYINFQPHLFQQSSSSFVSPYQISSRIIITNSGEVQYERNILGNSKPRHNRGFHFKQTMPLPPRSSGPATQFKESPRSPARRMSLPHSPSGRTYGNPGSKPERRASEVSLDCDDSYVFIPSIVQDPSRVPLPATTTAAGFESSSTNSLNFAKGASNSDRPLKPQASWGGATHVDATNGGSNWNGHPKRASSAENLEDYEDIVTVSRHPKNGNSTAPHGTQEMKSFVSLIPSPPFTDYVPMAPTSHQSLPPPKPRIKPRRSKPVSEPGTHPSFTLRETEGQMLQMLAKSQTLPTETSEAFSHHTLDWYSPEGRSSTSSPPLSAGVRDYYTGSLSPLPREVLTRQERVSLDHPPLTPPIPRPRPLFPRLRGTGSHDDSLVGRSSVRLQHNLSPPLVPHNNLRVTDL